MSSESLTLQQLKDMKEFARQMGAGGATGSMGDVPISSTILSIPGSKITGDIDGNAATATTAEKYALTSGQDASIEDALGLKADQSAMNTALAAKLDASAVAAGQFLACGINGSLQGAVLNGTSGNYMGALSLSTWGWFAGSGVAGYLQQWGASFHDQNWGINEQFRYIGLKMTYGIQCRSILASQTLAASDSRIKMNIEDVPDAVALEQVRQLPCCYYEYKDKVERGAGKTIGFIAQEVKEVLPMAVTTVTEFIPDHMRLAEVSWEEVDGKHLMTVSNVDAGVASGTKMRFAVSTGTPAELNEDGSVKTPASDDYSECTKDVVMREDGKFEMDKAYDSVFIIGREVDDFLMIDKAKIFALHHSAIQELDKTVEAQKATIAALEQQNAAQQAAIDALMARVAALEGQ